jgi:DHA2 family multidrug resistance protein-like MFS transporter
MLATARLLGQTAGATGMAILFHLMAGGATQTGLVIACGLAACAAVVSSLRGGGRVASPEPQAAEIG